MASRFIVASLLILQVVNCQYYGIPTPSFYPSYNYNYYSSNSNYYYPPPMPAPLTLAPTYPNISPRPPTSPPKRSVATPPNPKCSPPTASAYFLSTPTEKVKATVIALDKVETPPKYTCPLCNGFADIPPNPKIPPPPPVGSPVLPGILDKIPTIIIPDDMKIKDKKSVLKSKKPLLSDMYEKHKLPKNLRFDQELLEGFLTGLGL